MFAFSRKMWENRQKYLEMQDRLKGECHAGKSTGKTAAGKGNAAEQHTGLYPEADCGRCV